MGAGWAAAVVCAACSIVARIGLVGRLARAPSPRWRPRARSPLPLCSCALPLVLVSPQGSGSRQRAYTSLQFLPDIDLPVHGMRPATARPRLHRHTRIHLLLHALTAHQPVCASQGPMGQTPMAPQMDLKLLAFVHPATRGQRGDASGPAEAGGPAGGSHCGSHYLLVNP